MKRKKYQLHYYEDGNWSYIDSGTYLPGVGFKMRAAYDIKKGYTQTYWEDYITGVRYTPGSTVTLTTMNSRSFMPIYTLTNYTITYYDLFGVANNPYNLSSYTMESNDIYLSSPSGTRPGYTFDGWYPASIGGTSVPRIGKGSTGNKYLYARWTPRTYNITIASNGGTPVSTTITYSIETGSVVLNEPTRTGYTINGWSIRNFSPLSGPPTISGNTMNINGSYGNMTIMANWGQNILTAGF